jgi:hypothetical protein
LPLPVMSPALAMPLPFVDRECLDKSGMVLFLSYATLNDTDSVVVLLRFCTASTKANGLTRRAELIDDLVEERVVRAR